MRYLRDTRGEGMSNQAFKADAEFLERMMDEMVEMLYGVG